MSELSGGLIDTNVLIHALTRDRHSQDCREFLLRVRQGEQSFTLTTVVVYELTYALGRYKKEMSQAEIGDYLISVMALPNVRVDDDALFGAVRAWSMNPNLGFADAYLGVRAERDRVPVFTKNARHFKTFDVEVPNPLVLGESRE
jgi:predicted nucleic acid-binding protein